MKKTIILVFIFSLLIVSKADLQINGYKFLPYCNLWKIESSGSNLFNYPGLFTWTFMQSSTTSQITGIMFLDTLKGWITHTSNGAGRTTDGGLTWLPISFSDTTFTTLYNGVYFINPNTGWCVGGALQIRKTTNGGANWFKQTPPPAAGVFNSVKFFDEFTGIAIGRKNVNYNSFVAKTTNSGNNWFEIIASTATENELSGQYWFDANTGWICGRSILLKTTNGGLNYTNYYTNIPPTSNGINALLCITFVNQQTGWIGGSNLDHQNLYKTTNSGQNWFFQNNPAAGNTYAQINDVGFLSADSGWAIHGTPFSGAIMFTSNGGTNWITEEGSNNWFDCLSIYQRKKAWVGSSSGKVWYTYLTPPTGIRTISSNIPQKVSLYQNYPNPFNPITKIRFDIPNRIVIARSEATWQSFTVSLKIFDILGKEIQTLVNEELKPGTYEVAFDGSNLPSGIYFYQLQAGDFIETKKLVLFK
jgi:photosystem II stability/assembly factor-like uncharacterized protein